jgi:hypothetical protein
MQTLLRTKIDSGDDAGQVMIDYVARWELA